MIGGFGYNDHLSNIFEYYIFISIYMSMGGFALDKRCIHYSMFVQVTNLICSVGSKQPGEPTKGLSWCKIMGDSLLHSIFNRANCHFLSFFIKIK